MTTSVPAFFQRTHILIGDEGIAKLQQQHVLLAGLGGVGGYIAEAFARAGVGTLTLVDHDVVSASNLNRQLVALQSTLGQNKIAVMSARIADINPACVVRTHDAFVKQENLPSLLDMQPDIVVDAIDSLSSKVALLVAAHERQLPVFSSMGAGGRLDPTAVHLGDLMDSQVCHLARAVRSDLRRRGVGRGITAVWSDEVPRPPLPPEEVSWGRARAVNGTISYMPAIFGLMLAGAVIRYILEPSE